MKRIISIVLLSLIASLFQGMPAANAADGVPTWSTFTSTPNRSPDGFGCQWGFSTGVSINGAVLTNYLVTISTDGNYSSFPYAPTAGTVIKTDMPITPAQTSTTLVVLDRNFFSSFGAMANTTYHFFVKPMNSFGSSLQSYGIGNCAVSSFLPPGIPGTPTVVAGNSSVNVTIVAPATSSSNNSPSSYTVSAFDNSGNLLDPAKTCTVTVPSTSCEITGLNNGTPYKFKSTATNPAGTSSASALSSSATPTGPIAPTIASVSSSTTNGSYNVGDSISIQVTFSEAVTVTGTPQLTLETGSTDQVLNYASGSGTSSLTFTYTIQAGDTSSDLTYVATNSLALNGGTIKNSSSLDAVLTLPSPSASGSLAANKSLVIDTTLPTVSSFSSTTADGSYKEGAIINITATLSEVVTTAASITVTLDNGQTVVLTHSSENNTLTGSYTIGSGQSSSDLGISSYALTSAPTDVAGNVMTSTTMPAGNISGTRAIVVDTTTPTVSSFSSTTSDGAYKAGSTINITATLSEAVTTAASITVTLDNGKTVVLTHNAVNNTLTGTYTIVAGDASADLSVSSYALTSAPVDSAGNVMSDLTVPSGSNNIAGSKAIVVDTTAPNTPSTPDLATASDSAGTSDADNITSDNTPTINVSTSSGTAVVTATKGSSSVSCTISSTSCTLGTLADGVWSLTVTDTDSAGNASTSAALSITVDATKSVASVATLSQTNGTGATVPVQSNELGTAYLVGSGTSYTDPALVVTAAGTYKVTISAINTDTSIATTGLTAGTYKVYVIDAAGNLSLASTNTVTIAAASAPLAVATTAPSGTSAINSALTSTSTFSGVPTPSLTYQWVSCSDNTNAANCTNISGATSSTFTPSASALVGTYIRVLTTALNSEGSATSTSSPTTAVSAVAPGAPTLGTVVNGNLQITIPFTPPVSNGGSTITKYQYSLDGTTWLERTDSATVTSPIVIKFTDAGGTSPIVAGTAYTIQVRGVNAVSGGTAATTSAITAATAPGAPTAVSATATGQTTATVSFTAPASNGGSAITSYTVTSSPGGVSATGSTSPITVSGLTASTAYTFTVTASNAAATSVASTASTSVTTSAPPAPAPVGPSAPAPEPEPVCEAACIAAQVAAAKAAADKVIADRVAAAAKVVAEKIASDTAAKVVAEKVSVDRSAAEAAAKAAVDKAAAAAVAKAAADAAAAQAAVVAKAAADAQAAAVEAASKAAAALKSATTTAAAKATATATAAKAATTAANAVQAAAAAAKAAATAKNTASNASKQVDIAIGALGSQTASASSTAQANAIAAAAKAAANAAAKSAADQAAAAKTASNNANKEATDAAARIVIEQKEAADAAAAAKVAADADLKANELKIAAATESQKAMEAVVAALNEKVVLAEASVKAATVAERAEIDKKIADVSTKIVELQKVADEMQVKADAAIAAQVSTRAAVEAATQNATVQANEASAVKIESIEKTSAATKAAADASLAAKVATAAKAAAAKVPAKAVIAAKPSTSTKPNSTKATISGLKPGQKVKVTVNVKGK